MQRVDEILHFWFGHIEETFVPTQHLSQMWFSATPEIDQEIRSKFGSDLEKAILGEYDNWGDNPRSCLALIIIFDQFSRHIYRDTPMSFAQDDKSLDLCVRGIERQFDHKVSLIERAFFYMPLMHSENFDMQHTSVRAFKMLADLSFPEARPIFENFFDYSIRHYQVVERFKRFPHRNLILGRKNTPEEDEFLSIEGGGFK
jgi:uncharacterized protein (DUF924 family)